jgi:hypothetical protein
MNPLHYLIGLALAIGLPFGPVESKTPPLPFYDFGACPFECCTYGTWSAKTETNLRKDYDDSSPAVTVVNAGEDVRGLTGVVITTEAGEVNILKKIAFSVENSLEEILLLPGDVIYPLRYVGEGFDKYYFEGFFLIGQTNIRAVGKSENWQVIRLPKWVWWAKISRQNGDIGWTRELDHFAHIDACE